LLWANLPPAKIPFIQPVKQRYNKGMGLKNIDLDALRKNRPDLFDEAIAQRFAELKAERARLTAERARLTAKLFEKQVKVAICERRQLTADQLN
jgi:hypothetical protein